MPTLMTDQPSFTCDRHPDDHRTGFCPSCLHERLTILDHTASSSAAIKPIRTTPLPNAPDLRRTKSFSVPKFKELGFLSGGLEPQRKSCDVRRPNKEDNVTNYYGGEVRVSEEENLNDLESEIVEMEAKIDAIVGNLESIKDQIDRDVPTKKPSSSNFFTKKWQNWRRKPKKSVVDQNSVVSRTLPEIPNYGFGRFSLDAGRVSFDKPRASCDVKIGRSDMLFSVEGDVPGGSTQTREYYLNSSSSRRRKGLERSSSIRTMAASVVDNQNTKVSPACVDYNHVRGRFKFRSIGGEKELERDSNSSSLKDDGEVKKGRWWNWKVWSRKSSGERECNGELRSGINSKLRRSVSWRKSSFVESGKNK